MKRVCIVRQTLYPWQKNVRRNAETLVREGYEVDVICQRERGQRRREVINGVNVHRLSLTHRRGSVFWYLVGYSAFFLLAMIKLIRLFLKKRYDVIEVHTMPDFLVFVAWLPKLFGSRVILYMFENTPALFMSSYGVGPNHIGARLLRLIEKVSAGYADHVIVSDGHPYKRILESRGIRSDKITVVLNVPDDAIFNSDLSSNGDGQHFRLIVVSTLLKRYGIQTLIRALPLLAGDIPELMVDVVGDGEYRPHLERMARELNVDKHLNFAGHVKHDNVPSYVSKAHVGVAPMINDVGAPNKLFEYFALGKPAVASALPGLTEMFGGDCIQYFEAGNERDLANRILELYRSPDRRNLLSASARAVYQQCRWSVMKQRYLGVYRQLLS
jgi:glycosyltransferase involved in cell wall biosynthesis